jgi:hypothetical protein
MHSAEKEAYERQANLFGQRLAANTLR